MDQAARVKEARESLGFTQVEAAEAAGLSHRAWQTYEQGVTPPSAQALAMLLRYGISALWVMFSTSTYATFRIRTGNSKMAVSCGFREGVGWAIPLFWHAENRIP